MGLVRTLRHRAFLVAALTGVIVAALGVGWHQGAFAGLAPAAERQTEQPAADPTPPTDRPNIVFVLTDDLSMNLLPFMPNVQALQQRGMSFSRYITTNSLCCPARSSVLTGGFPHTTGVLTNGGADGGHAEFAYRKDDRQTFATSLKAAGYTTALMGKYLNGYRANPAVGGPRAAVPPGWSEWYVPGDQDGYSGYNYTLNENGSLVRYGQTPEDYLTDVLSAKGADFIRRTTSTGKPFLLEVSTFSPHAPYTPAPRHADEYPGLTYPRTPAFARAKAPGDVAWLAAQKPVTPATKTALDQAFRKRAQAVRSVDDLVANLTETLESKDLLANTYLVFTSDNGYHMGEHRLGTGKMTAFDTDIKVPLIVAGPGVQAGSTSDALVANIDLCPTFTDLGRAVRPALVDGQSLVPLLHGKPATDWRKAVLIEHRHPTGDQVGPDRDSPGGGYPPTYNALRFRDSVYVEYANGQREYYDIAKDPYELRNLAAQLTPARRAALHRSVAALIKCRGTASCQAAGRAAAG